MASIDASIEVEVPLSRAYNQWTQFESFPLFMEGVREVRQVDDTHLHWVVEVGGRVKEWDAEIVSQEPDHRVAWHSTGGTPEAGVVTFEPVGPDATRIDVVMEYLTDGPLEAAGEVLGFAGRRVRGDLERFKEYIETHRDAGEQGWRGRVGESGAPDVVTPDDAEQLRSGTALSPGNEPDLGPGTAFPDDGRSRA
ncbi:MAG: SRPBCC family protein [Kineosporiaceae bacterium]|nr:SRPBCC family protein [Kineosporiaceae bacterium]